MAKREVSFFKDKRANTAQALIGAFRAVGMTDSEIKDAMLKLKAEKDALLAQPAPAPEQAAPVGDRHE